MQPNPRKSCKQMILNFTPSWFSVNMGTGIISILLYSAPHQFPGMKYIATVFYLLNCAIFTLFLSITIARYILFPYVFKRMLNHSTQSLFVGTFPMGLSTITNATVLIVVPVFGHWAAIFAWVLWWIDVFFTILSCFGIPFVMFNAHQITIDKLTAAWLLPFVPNVVTAAAGGLVATVLEPHHALITIIVSYCLWGVGMGTSIVIVSLYIYRLLIFKLPEPELIVSAFLPLGPFGQGAFGIIQLAQAGRTVFPATNFLNMSGSGDFILAISTIIGLLLWGWGLWWLVHGVSSVLAKAIKGKVPFSIGFWGFIFPLGVFTAATIALGKALPSEFLSDLAMAFIVCLMILWLGIAPCLTEMVANMV